MKAVPAGRRGFSLIELILVVGIIVIIGVEAGMMGGSALMQNNLDTDKVMIVSSLRKAQSYAMSKKNGLTWGVCLTGNFIRVFGGSCASPIIKDDYDYSNSTAISGLTTMTFSNLRGEPSTAQTIVLTGNNKTVTITVNLLGGLAVN